MSTQQLREIYRAADENANGTRNYMYPEIDVNGMTLSFDVDMDLERDMDDPEKLQRAVGISYGPVNGGADDLVYTRRIDGSTGVADSDIVSEDEFVQRVTELAEEWRARL